MRGRCGVICPNKIVGTPNQEIWVKRGGDGKTSGSGPSGWKTTPARLLARSMAEMAAKYRTRKK